MTAKTARPTLLARMNLEIRKTSAPALSCPAPSPLGSRARGVAVVPKQG